MLGLAGGESSSSELRNAPAEVLLEHRISSDLKPEICHTEVKYEYVHELLKLVILNSVLNSFGL